MYSRCIVRLDGNTYCTDDLTIQSGHQQETLMDMYSGGQYYRPLRPLVSISIGLLYGFEPIKEQPGHVEILFTDRPGEVLIIDGIKNFGMDSAEKIIGYNSFDHIGYHYHGIAIEAYNVSWNKSNDVIGIVMSSGFKCDMKSMRMLDLAIDMAEAKGDAEILSKLKEKKAAFLLEMVG
jgi:hypothetical protein